MDSANAKCVNKKKTHDKGHQDATGRFLDNGPFCGTNLNPALFINSIETSVRSAMRSVNGQVGPNSPLWHKELCTLHEIHIEKLRRLGAFAEAVKADLGASDSRVCYGCLFRNPNYRLPCRHVLCEACLRDYGQDGAAFSSAVLRRCIICGDSEKQGWPFKVRLKPDLGGLRVLSLDGGGVRGIVQLVILEKLEALTGLDIPIGSFFDLVVGTNSGAHSTAK